MIPIKTRALQEAGQEEQARTNRKRYRRWCFYCTETYKDAETNRVKHRSRFEGSKPQRVQLECLACHTALCTTFCPTSTGPYANMTCADRFHKVKRLK